MAGDMYSPCSLLPFTCFGSSGEKPRRCFPQASHCGYKDHFIEELMEMFDLPGGMQVKEFRSSLDPYFQQAAHFYETEKWWRQLFLDVSQKKE